MAQTICLNLLLESDHSTVFSAVESVIELIDYWVIAERSCNESILTKLEELLSEVPGEIVTIEFDDNAEARNSLLEYSRNKADYLLFLDDDIILKAEDFESFEDLNSDAYFIHTDNVVQSAKLRLIRSMLACRYFGAVQEYLAVEGGIDTEVLSEITSQRISSQDNFERKLKHDELVLQATLDSKPDDAHSLFHLAKIRLGQSQHQSAFDLYNQFVKLPDQIDAEWSWYAHYSIARLMEVLEHEPQSVINAYLFAHQQRPARAEALIDLARYYRQSGDYSLAYIYSSQAFRLPLPVLETFDLNRRVYDWHIPAEHSLISQQLNKHEEVVQAANKALVYGKATNNMRDSLINSRQRSLDVLQQANESNVAKNNHIRLLIPFRNASAYLQRCITSIQNQDYDNYTATFIDDCSTDGSADLIPEDNPHFEIICNTERVGAMLNRMNFILSCEPDDIVVYLDGDDQLASDGVLNYVSELYNKYDCWLSYGQYISQNGKTGHAVPYTSQENLIMALESGDMRFPIHPITHRAGLFQQISKFDPEYSCFKGDDGEWLFYASDAVLARPLFYLAGVAKIHYCNRVLYLYTEGHESSVYVSNNKEQIETCRIITKRLRLPVIESYSG